MDEWNSFLYAAGLPNAEELVAALETSRHQIVDSIENFQELLQAKSISNARTASTAYQSKDKEAGHRTRKGRPLILNIKKLLPIERALEGTGVLVDLDTTQFRLNVPAGVQHGSILKVSEFKSLVIYVTILIQDDPVFSFKDRHLCVKCPLTPEEATQGMQLLRIPSATEMVSTRLFPDVAYSKQTLCIGGKGWPEPDGSSGDLFLQFVFDENAQARRKKFLPISRRSNALG